MVEPHESPEPPRDRERVTPARRQWLVDALCEAYARDELGVRELERRLDEAHRLRFESELRTLIGDLGSTDPQGNPGNRVSQMRVGSGEEGSTASRQIERRSWRVPVRGIDAGEAPNRQLSVGVWSGRVRKGSWIPARRITALALQGGVELDFREAVFRSSTVDVSAIAVMGGIHIIVPPDLRVEASGFAIMGGFEERSQFDASQTTEGPTLRIRGFALMGGIQIDARLPGETSRDARRRRRRERRSERR